MTDALDDDTAAVVAAAIEWRAARVDAITRGRAGDPLGDAFTRLAAAEDALSAITLRCVRRMDRVPRGTNP